VGHSTAEAKRLFCTDDDSNGDMHVFAIEYAGNSGARKFVAATYEGFWYHYCLLPEGDRHHYELVQEGWPCHLYFDIEFQTACNPNSNGNSMIDTFIERLQQQLRAAYGIELQREWIVDLDSTTAKKFSRHLICHMQTTDGRTAVFQNNIHAGAFVRRLCRNIELESQGDDENALKMRSLMIKNQYIDPQTGQQTANVEPFVDQAVYSRNRTFRLYRSSKFGKNTFLRRSEANTFMQCEWKLVEGDSPQAVDDQPLRDSMFFQNATVERDFFMGALITNTPQAARECVASYCAYYTRKRAEADKNQQQQQTPKSVTWSMYDEISGEPTDDSKPYSMLVSAVADQHSSSTDDNTSTDAVVADENVSKHRALHSTVNSQLTRRWNRIAILRCRDLNRNVVMTSDGGMRRYHASGDTVSRMASTVKAKGYIVNAVLTPTTFPGVDAFVTEACAQTAGVAGYIRSWVHLTPHQRLSSSSTTAMQTSSCPTHGTICYEIARNRFCANIGRQHRSNGVYIVVDLDRRTLYQKCHDPVCRAANFRSSEVRIPDLAFECDDAEFDAALAQVDIDSLITHSQTESAAATGSNDRAQSESDADLDFALAQLDVDKIIADHRSRQRNQCKK
jgi:Herpesviridae UL52/UL70 DNA primase